MGATRELDRDDMAWPPVTVVTSAPAPDPGSDYHYDQMVRRVAAHYAYRFSHI